MATSKFAFFFDEGLGYLFADNIGTPCNSEVQLVKCIADGKLYVRKENFPIPLHRDSNQTSCNEVRFYRPHANIPRLIDWLDRIDSQIDGDHLSTTSVWEYCNGNNLQQFLWEAQGLGIPLPEAFIWKLLYQVATTLDFIHFGCQPSIGQGDFHTGNIFLHWEDDSSALPEFKLGDFGCAHSYKLTLGYVDFCHFYNGLSNIVRPSTPGRSTPYSQELISAIDGLGEFYMHFSWFYRHNTLHPESRRLLRSELASLLALSKSRYQHALTSISDQDREHMLRLKPNNDTRVLMCDSLEALMNTPYQVPAGLWKVVEVNSESLEVLKVIEEACVESGIFLEP